MNIEERSNEKMIIITPSAKVLVYDLLSNILTLLFGGNIPASTPSTRRRRIVARAVRGSTLPSIFEDNNGIIGLGDGMLMNPRMTMIN